MEKIALKFAKKSSYLSHEYRCLKCGMNETKTMNTPPKSMNQFSMNDLRCPTPNFPITPVANFSPLEQKVEHQLQKQHLQQHQLRISNRKQESGATIRQNQIKGIKLLSFPKKRSLDNFTKPENTSMNSTPIVLMPSLKNKMLERLESAKNLVTAKQNKCDSNGSILNTKVELKKILNEKLRRIQTSLLKSEMENYKKSKSKQIKKICQVINISKTTQKKELNANQQFIRKYEKIPPAKYFIRKKAQVNNIFNVNKNQQHQLLNTVTV